MATLPPPPPAAAAAAPDIEDDYLDGVGTLFLSTSFVPLTLSVGPHALTLAVSAAASTDYDLTGQALWPASRILADFLAGTPEGVAAVRAAGAIVELGAGLGLAGLAAAAAAAGGAPPSPAIVLTDGEPALMDVLRANAASFAADRPGVGAAPGVRVLGWGDGAGAAALVAATPAAAAVGGFPLVLGADVTYSLAAVPALFATAAALAVKNGPSVFYLGYVSRSAALDRAVPSAAAGAGWGAGREVPGTRRVMPCGMMKGWVAEFRRGVANK